MLKARTAALYAQKLDEVLRGHEWVDKPYGKKKDVVWTVDKSKELRPTVTDCWKRWTTGALKIGVNVLTAALAKWYNKDATGEKPSGQNLEQAEEFVLDFYYKFKTGQSKKKKGDGRRRQGSRQRRRQRRRQGHD